MKLDIPSRHRPSEADPAGAPPPAPATPAVVAALPGTAVDSAASQPTELEAVPSSPSAAAPTANPRHRGELGPLMADAINDQPSVHLKRPPDSPLAPREEAPAPRPEPVERPFARRRGPWRTIAAAAGAVAVAAVGAVTLTRIGGTSGPAATGPAPAGQPVAAQPAGPPADAYL